MEKKSAIGLVGLGVMGQNLARNLARNGYKVSIYNRHEDKTRAFIKNYAQEGSFVACYNLNDFICTLERPRIILMMIKAGEPIDMFIEELYPLLDYNDLLVDGGNSYYKDTMRRCAYLDHRARLFIGCGISGGAEGALLGPSMMPGGMKQGWPLVEEMFMRIAAKTEDGTACCKWMGPGGAGHFVKMVHNGIEYADMQLISEAYGLMKDHLGMSNEQIKQVFEQWNTGLLSSYLVEITAQVLSKKEGQEYVLDKILDVAGQKGTGKWSVDSALDLHVSLGVIANAVEQRDLSQEKEFRAKMAQAYTRDIGLETQYEKPALSSLEQALYAAKIISYEQGFSLLHAASDSYDWQLNMADIASIWRAGCIIRSTFLDNIKQAYTRNEELQSILLDAFFQQSVESSYESWGQIVAFATQRGMPIPGHSTALNYFNSCRSESLPINLIQGQRDLFGAHMYERVDSPRGRMFHTQW